jgi:geranylgeranyl diphosphate synthase type II
MPFAIEQYLKTRAQAVEDVLNRLLPANLQSPPPIAEAMRYSLLAGGKRIRPILCLATVETLGTDWQSALPAACSIEMIHTYSLIHDDLPAMDNDDYRRGKLTNHKVFGDAIAILAGDGLLTYAFQILSEHAADGMERSMLAIIRELSRASGVQGMIGGQVADIRAEGRKGSKETLEYIHKHKTGDLLTASVRIGAIFAGAAPHELSALTSYADKLGLAFQIQDDILDVVGDQAKLGKQTGVDATLEKMTYPAVYGLQESIRKVRVLTEESFASLAQLPYDTTILRAIADFLVHRES